MYINPNFISIDPGAAFRALEIWRGQDDDSHSYTHDSPRGHAGSPHSITLWRQGLPYTHKSAATFPHAAALALRAALLPATAPAGGGK